MTEVYWLQQTAADVPTGGGWLSPGELSRLAGMRFEKRRADWRLGRWTAKRALAARYFPCHLHHIEIRSAPSGAPEVYLCDRPAAVTISLSHRAGTAVCAVAPRGVELGCDVELIEERDPAFTRDYFTPAEQVLVTRAPPADRAQLQTLIWSAKESALKALRAGLRLDTRCVEVCLGAQTSVHEWQPLQVLCAGSGVFRGWWKQRGLLVWTFVVRSSPTLENISRKESELSWNCCGPSNLSFHTPGK